jgi:hypothetical protein
MHEDYPRDEMDYIYDVNVSCASVSIVGSMFIIVVFFLFKRMRRLPFRYIFYLTIADLGTALGFCLDPRKYWSCQIQGGLISYFLLSSVIWCALISHAMNSVLIDRKDIRRYEFIYLLLGFVLPLAVFLVLFDIEKYQPALGWCWIYQQNRIENHYYRQILYRMLTYYIPLFVVEIYVVVHYFSITRYLKSASCLSGIDDSVKNAIITKLKLFPIGLIIMQLPCAIIRFASFSETPPWYWTAIAGAGLTLNGLFNALVYGITQEVKKEIIGLCHRLKGSELLSENNLTVED